MLGIQSLLTALAPVLSLLTNLKFLDLSPTIGIGRAQSHEELALCQAWSKVCGLSKVMFPSGDTWLLTASSPSIFSTPYTWILSHGHAAGASTKPLWWEDGTKVAGISSGPRSPIGGLLRAPQSILGVD